MPANGVDGSVIIEVDADTKGFDDSIKDIGKKAEEALDNVKEWDDIISELSNSYKSLGSAIRNNAETGADSTQLYEKSLEILGEQISATEQKLSEMRAAQHDVNEAFASGDLGLEQWAEYQNEISKTANELENLRAEQDSLQGNGIEHFLGDTSNGFDDVSNSADEAGQSTLQFGDILKANLASEAIKAAISELVKVIQELGQEMTNIVIQAGAMGDTIDKQSQRLGMSNEAYQEWSYILSQNGADISTLTMGMRTLTNKIDGLKNGTKSATQAFAQLGLSFKDLKGLTGEEQLSLVIERLQGIEDETTRNAVANDVLGRSYMQLIPLLNQSSDTVETLRQRAHDTNQIMSDEGVEAAVNYTDAMDTLTKSFTGFKNDLGAEVLPGIVEIIDGITDLINNVDGAEDKIEKGIEDTLQSLENVIPKVGALLGKIISATEEKAPEIISAMAQALIKGLPKISKAILGIVPVVVQTISDILPDIGTAAATIATEIFRVVLETISDAENTTRLFNAMVEFGYNLCVGIADGIVNFDWGAFTNTLLTKLGNVLDEAQRHTMLWIDNLFGGGKLYGGDINNVESTDWMKAWREGAQVITETVDEATQAAQGYYQSGKDILADVFKTTSDAIESGEEEEEKVIEDAANAQQEAVKNYTQAIDVSTEKTKKKQEKLNKVLQDQLNSLDHLFKTHQITEGEYWARKKALLEKYREDDNEEWHKLYDDVKDHYKKLSDKNKEAFKKAKKEEQDAISKAEKDYRNSLTKDINSTKSAFNNLLKEYQSGYNDIIKQRDDYKSRLMGGSVFEVLQKTDEKTGEQYKEYTINNLKDKLKQRTQYANEIAKLEQRELSAGLLKELESMDIGDATVFAKQINKMSDAEFNELNNAYKKLDEDTTRLANERYQDELDSLNEDFVTKAEGLIDGMNGDLKVLGYDGAKSWLGSFKMGFDDSVEDFSKSINGLFDNLSSTVNDETQSIYQIMQGNLDTQGVGEKMIDTIINGLESKQSVLQEKMRDLLSVSKYLDFLYADIASQSAKQSSAGYSSASAQTQTANQQQGTNTATQTAPQTVVVDNKQSGQVNKQSAEKVTIDANLVLTDKAGQIIADIVNAYNKRIEIGVGK